MKLKALILALLLSTQLHAENGYINSAKFFVFTGYWTAAIPMVITFNKNGVVHDWERSGVLISVSQDPMVKITQDVTNLKFKGGVKLKRWHPYIAYEWAGYPVNLEAYTLGCYYQFYQRRIKKFGNKYGVAFKGGYETGRIKNEGQKVWTHGLSLRGELWFRKHDIGIFGEWDYFLHPELTVTYMMFTNIPALNGTPSGRAGVYIFIH